MSDQPTNPPFDPSKFAESFPTPEEVKDRAKEALQNPAPQVIAAKSFYIKNKPLVITAVVVVVGVKLHKRGVAKYATKAVEKALEGGVRINVEQYFQDLEAWEKARYAAWSAVKKP